MLCIMNNSSKHQSFVYTQLKDLFLTTQFSLCHLFALNLKMSIGSIWPIDRILSGATTSIQSEPGSNGNEGVLPIPQSSNITGALPSDCLASYPGHLFCGGGGILPLCRDTARVFYSPSQLGCLFMKV